MRTLLLITILGLVAPALAGCIGSTDEAVDPSSTDAPTDGYDTSRGWSVPVDPALYDVLPGVEVRVPSFDGTEISLGIFLPEIEGCDWEADELAGECELPVLMDAGPYYGPGVDQDKYRPPWIEWLVPRGYGVVQMSVRGTGESAGCMEFLSMTSTKDVDAMVTWIAEQPWSNGNVAMGGRSYDGTTPLMAAAMGNPHLKTIIPISGVPDFKDLMFKNGTSETRGPIMHSVVYWAFYGVGATYGPGAASFRADHWTEQACQETVLGQAEGTHATATGETNGLVDEQYWTDRDFAAGILENYNGSVWIVHGLHDWNVNPSQVVPWINELQDAGIDTRAWLGVWGHAYPDRVDEHRNVRWDWAQQTLEWLDFYLKGEGERPPLDVEVEDSLFVWRHENSFPPRDATFEPMALAADMSLGDPSEASEGEFVLTGPPTGEVLPGSIAGATGPMPAFSSAPLQQDLRISGLPRLHLTITPNAPTSDYVFAELYDVFPDGRSVRIGWAAMNLLHHDGGNDDPATLVPGQPVVARMEFEPMDAHVAAGHQLRLVVHKGGVEDILPTPNSGPNTLHLGADSVLYLSTIERPTVVPSYAPPGLGGDGA